MSAENNIKVRFAPSPTGFLHLGSARTALFNWLFARHAGGKLVLRIEDTDKTRSKKEFLDEILKDLAWLGMDWDEGPFYQSERISAYKNQALKLLEKGLAYREGEAIIFRVEKSRSIKINDIIHGEIVFNTDEIKDQVLIKSDGHPTYNFACVLDDCEMGITHILRGDDHISNTPKQILFYEALSRKQPQFAHMPLMMGTDGAKLSKRHGAVAVFEYRKEGFLPEALSNYLLLLGWSPGEEKEIISLQDAAKLFDIKDISSVQAKFDIDKLKWINKEYIMNKNTGELAAAYLNLESIKGLRKYLETNEIDKSYFERITGLYKTRFGTSTEYLNLTKCFFTDDFSIDPDALTKCGKYLKDEKTKKALSEFGEELQKMKRFDKEKIEKTCRDIAEKYSIKAAAIIHSVRAAISGKTAGAGLFEMMELLGKNRVTKRLKKFINQYTK